MDEHKQAISFTNSYFALVDGLASGLENHLAEDVVLDWFGRTIKGRKNVTSFIEGHKVNSRHIFSNIAPTSSIGYKKKNLNRKKKPFSYQNQINPNFKGDISTDSRTCEKTFFQGFAETARDDTKGFNRNDIDTKEGISLTDDMSYDLNEGDLTNLFKLEITSTNIEEIERSINRIKLEEEMAPTIKAIKRECGQGDGPVIVETSTIKYVEASGEIDFSRKFIKRDTWDKYSSVVSNVHTWKRPCTLQIAYSALAESQSSEPSRKSEISTSRVEKPKGRLPSLEEINAISNRLVPGTVDFGGLLKSDDFYEDCKQFLESLEMEMEVKDSRKLLLSPQYIDNKLVLNRPCVDLVDSNDQSKKKFLFNYKIHLIIYEGTNRCRVNLLDEFEKTKI